MQFAGAAIMTLIELIAVVAFLTMLNLWIGYLVGGV
jgi:hypothetical protein